MRRRRHNAPAMVPSDAPNLAFVGALRAAFAAHADARRAAPMQAYMKSALPFHGIAAPLRRRLATEAVKTHPCHSSAELAATMLALFGQARFREECYAAVELPRLSAAHRALVDASLLPVAEKLIRDSAWWDLVDDLSGELLQALLLRAPQRVKPALRRWARGDNLWLRRAALLCQRGLSAPAFDAVLLYDCILPSIGAGPWRGEFFIRKGIGWALRERAYDAPEEVQAFCREYASQLAPLSVREAMKVLQKRSKTDGQAQRPPQPG
jgi:3-methyladenine DNA glycosylase AlkD